MYAEALFGISGIKNGKRQWYDTCYTEAECRVLGDKAACDGFMFVEVKILRFLRQPV